MGKAERHERPMSGAERRVLALLGLPKSVPAVPSGRGVLVAPPCSGGSSG